jgi:two-component system sensor histidine kinase/response regulator
LHLLEDDIVAPSDIMIVDDNPANLKLLEDMLSRRGHDVRSFPRGRLALAAAAHQPPDLILLDINMPEMDGYQMCACLKSDPALAAIPVIFLSALTDTQDKVRAFQSGAVDFVSKPFQFEEVHARVATHLQLHHLQQALRRQNENLEGLVAIRTAELHAAAERLTILDQSKSEFLNLISHEFRTPLNGLLGVGELVLDQMAPTDQNRRLAQAFKVSRQKILCILDDALLLTQIDVSRSRFKSASVSLSGAVARAVEDALELAQARQVTLSAPSSDLKFVVGDEALLGRALQALLETAIKFSEKGESVRLTSEVVAGSRNVIIESRGRNIPSEALPKFFDVFAIGEAMTPGGDLGLGPPVACRILSLFGASVSVANCDPSGIRLTISLKDALAPSHNSHAA